MFNFPLMGGGENCSAPNGRGGVLQDARQGEPQEHHKISRYAENTAQGQGSDKDA